MNQNEIAALDFRISTLSNGAVKAAAEAAFNLAMEDGANRLLLERLSEVRGTPYLLVYG